MFQAERERVTLIVADTSPALYFGTACASSRCRQHALARLRHGPHSAAATASVHCAVVIARRRSRRPAVPAAYCAYSMHSRAGTRSHLPMTLAWNARWTMPVGAAPRRPDAGTGRSAAGDPDSAGALERVGPAP
ncbi:hypothetical protein B0X78_11105 [bacterium AM6]|nr:hypothetical protein B0X78_11105 [bacterium AM6]